jgi:hypothetical protein
LNTNPDNILLDQPRTIGEIVRAAMGIYARRPLLFLTLTGAVVIPYEVIFALVSSGSGKGAAVLLLLLGLIDLALVNPFVTALETWALLDLSSGVSPSFGSVFTQALRVLPVVAAAEIVAGLSEFAGFVIFVLPGIYLAVRLAVAAPVAAVERTNWIDAIRRTMALTRHNFWRVLGLLAIQGLLTYLVAVIIGDGNTLASTIIGLLFAVLAQSFTTLLVSLLYFDLNARAARLAP